MWIGFGITMFLCLLKGVHFYQPRVPAPDYRLPTFGEYVNNPVLKKYLANVGIGTGSQIGLSFCVLAIALPLTHTAGVARPGVFVFGTLAVLLVAAQVGVIAGSLAKSLDHVYSMESIILLPLGFLGGVFYSVDQLPPVWDVLSRINPVFWLVQVERIGVLGRADVGAAAAVSVVWALAAVLSLWSAAIFGTNRLKA